MNPLPVLLLLLAPAGRQGSDETYEALVQEFTQARNDYMRKAADARKAGDTAAFRALKDPVGDFVPRFTKGAEMHAGTEEAVPYLTWLATNALRADREAAVRAIETLAKDHVESAGLGPVVAMLGRMGRLLTPEKVRGMLDRVIEGSPHDEIVAQALYARAEMILGGEPGPEEQAAAIADLKRVQEIAKDSPIAARAEGLLFEAENLQIGSTAPDIEGNDLDGVAFKLSDYRGKVVVIDFWGDW